VGCVFEIGNTLREARTRLGLELPEVERRTRIQTRFLVALEEERFELLPGDAYARGFLRSYAEALGLDGQLFLDEYKARFGEHVQKPLVPLAQVELPRRRALPALGAAVLVVTVAGLVAVLVLGLRHGGAQRGPSLARVRASPQAPAHARPRPRRPLVTLPARPRAIGAWDPDGDGHEHDDEAPRATDGDHASYWRTETYAAGLQKPGVGLLLDAGAPVRLADLSLSTDTPGFRALIEAGASAGGPFTAISRTQTVGAAETFALRGNRARYYLVWITRLDHVVHVNEVRADRLNSHPR
jgi:Helix-turn-helix domain